MKLNRLIFAFLVVLFSGCSSYDFSGLTEKINLTSERFSKQDKERILYRWAPEVYQQIRTPKKSGYDFVPSADYIVKINFDNNWDATDNWENGKNPDYVKNDLRGFSYTSFIATETHFFLSYSFFHSVDDAEISVDRHENDLEQVFICIKRDDSFYGSFRAMLTNSHNVLRPYSDSFGGKKIMFSSDGRPKVYITSNGTGFYHGHAIFALKKKFKLDDTVHYSVRYSHVAPSDDLSSGKAGYRLLLVDDSIWKIRKGYSGKYLGDPFSSFGRFADNRYGRGAGAPWFEKEAFFDPAGYFKLRFPLLGLEDYKRNYTYHPYIEGFEENYNL